MDTLPGASALYLPLKGSQHVLGVMAVQRNAAAASPEQQHLLEIFASQTALAIERAQATTAASDAQLRIEKEQMRSSLLSTVSHDLRTPLATITGAATSLLAQSEHMTDETQKELLESIAQEAERLGRLVNNLLEMTRLESGAAEVRRDWHPLEEIVGAALTRLERLLGDRKISIEIPETPPLVSVDDVLLEQVFLNLLENAAKYTPQGSAARRMTIREWPSKSRIPDLALRRATKRWYGKNSIGAKTPGLAGQALGSPSVAPLSPRMAD